MKPVIGIIGGSGLDNPEIFTDRQEKEVKTPFGDPSDKLIFGNIGGVKCVLLARHGRNHHLNPSNVNYRANIWALKHSGCSCIVVSAAVGSLQPHILPGHIVILDQFFDRTTKRASTFYDGSCKDFPGVSHIPMANPFAPEINKILNSVLEEQKLTHHTTGTVLVIEGPRFSTRFESQVFQKFGASVIGMTTVPEVVLANEIGLPYAALTLVTDMDAWQQQEHVTTEKVMQQMKENAEKFKAVLMAAIPKLHQLQWDVVADKYQTQAKKSLM